MASDYPALTMPIDRPDLRTSPDRLSRLRPFARVRAALLCLTLFLFLVIGGPLQWLSVHLKLFPAHWLPALFHRCVTALLGIRIIQTGAYKKDAPCLLVSNHFSWSDIIALSCCGPMRFVAKSEVAAWPLFGTFARLQRTIFVERGKRVTIPRVNEKMAEAMSAHDPVVLFAEATSSDGTRVRRFRSSHMRAALMSAERAPDHIAYAQPVAIFYRGRWGMSLGRHERSDLAWYGDMDLVPHLWSLMCQAPIECHISFGEPRACDSTTDVKALTAEIERDVRTMIGKIRKTV
jgi:lyso-ornithine lipid O-acyltransferase